MQRGNYRKDFLRYLHCIQDTNTKPDYLKKYLENKYILSLGCEIPDWTFRFLLYSLKEKEGRLEGISGEDMFDGGALSKVMDDNLYSFLANCLNLKKVDTFGSNTKSKNETKDTDTTSVL